MNYFQHSYYLRSEPRVKRLIDEMDYPGYGILMTLIEEIRKASGHVSREQLLAFSTRRTQRPMLERVLDRYGLFDTDQNGIVSLSNLALNAPKIDDRRQLSLVFDADQTQ